MDGTDWRMKLVARYKSAFETGDLRDIEKILGPNFHELVERDEISRIAQLDRLKLMIDSSRSRTVHFSSFTEESGDLLTDCVLDFQVDNDAWTISVRMRFRFDDGLIDHIKVWDVVEGVSRATISKAG